MQFTLVRLVVLFIVFFALYVGLQLAPGAVFHVQSNATYRGLYDLASAGFLAFGMIVAYRLSVRLIERRSADELELANSASGIFIGIGIGFGIFTCVYAALWFKGFAHITGFSGTQGIGQAAAIAIASAVGEEIVFRGIFFRILDQSFGTITAVVLSSAVFGLLHALNHGATWWSTTAVALEGGAMLGAAFAASRTLWLPIGLHFGWNFTEGGIFGAAVSGGTYHGLIANTLSGPAIWTGGAFGPEASAVAVITCLPIVAILMLIAVLGGRWQHVAARLRVA